MIPAASEVLTTNEVKKAENRVSNKLAYCDLLHACEDDVSLGCVDSATSTKLPHGDARLAWKQLKDRYEPETGASKVELKQQLACSRPKKNEDPGIWLVELERICHKLQNTHLYVVEDQDIMIHVINSLPE